MDYNREKKSTKEQKIKLINRGDQKICNYSDRRNTFCPQNSKEAISIFINAEKFIKYCKCREK
jgi:hypothetical protein